MMAKSAHPCPYGLCGGAGQRRLRAIIPVARVRCEGEKKHLVSLAEIAIGNAPARGGSSRHQGHISSIATCRPDTRPVRSSPGGILPFRSKTTGVRGAATLSNAPRRLAVSHVLFSKRRAMSDVFQEQLHWIRERLDGGRFAITPVPLPGSGERPMNHNGYKLAPWELLFGKFYSRDAAAIGGNGSLSGVDLQAEAHTASAG